MANGKVITGYSKPWVALYNNNAGTVTYSGGMPLARGVDVSVDVEASDDNNFYADNVLAETGGGTFSSGTLGLTVDGLKAAARKLIQGVTNTVSFGTGDGAITVDAYDEDTAAPYMGFGCVVRYMENGVTSYTMLVLPKIKFNPESLSAATQEENIEFQTTSLEASIMRDDTAKHNWKFVLDDLPTEAEAVAAYQQILTPATP